MLFMTICFVPARYPYIGSGHHVHIHTVWIVHASRIILSIGQPLTQSTPISNRLKSNTRNLQELNHMYLRIIKWVKSINTLSRNILVYDINTTNMIAAENWCIYSHTNCELNIIVIGHKYDNSVQRADRNIPMFIRSFFCMFSTDIVIDVLFFW